LSEQLMEETAMFESQELRLKNSRGFFVFGGN